MSELIAHLLSDPFVTSLLLGLGITAVGLWLAACWWVYRDAHRRAERGLGPYLASAWVFLSGPVLLPLSLGIYAFARPQEATAERRSRELLANLDPDDVEADACRGCGRAVDADWRRCPICATWLGLRCDRCERWAPADAGICPWCAWEPGAAADPETLVVRPLVAVMEPVGMDATGMDPAGADAPTTVQPVAAHATAAATPASMAAAGVAAARSRPDAAAWIKARPRLVRSAPSIRTAFRGQGSAPGDRRSRERGTGQPAGGRTSG